MTLTVREIYCQDHSIDESEFTTHLLKRTLYPAARLALPVLSWVTPRPFAEDLTYLDCIGRIRTAKQLSDETHDFRNQSANRRFSRRVLHLRISVGRVHAIVKPLLRAESTSQPGVDQDAPQGS